MGKMDPELKAAVLKSLVAPQSGLPVDIRIDGSVGKQIESGLSEVAGAIKGIKPPVMPEHHKPIDNGKELGAIAKAIGGLNLSGDVAKAITEIAKAVSGIRSEPTDLSDLSQAIRAQTKALTEVLKELRKPRRIITDADGIPTGIQ